MVRDDPKSDIDFLLLRKVGARLRQRRPVAFAAQLFELFKDRPENVGLVIGNWFP